jgi:hypothetical protein
VGRTVCAVCGEPRSSSKADGCQWCGAQEVRDEPRPEPAKKQAAGGKPAKGETKRRRKSRSVWAVPIGLPSLGKRRR